MECNFDHIFARGVVQTIYHDLDFDYRIKFGDIWGAFYGDRDFVASLLPSSDSCTMSILQTCHLPGDVIANMTENTGYSCPCLRSYYVYPHSYV